MSLENQCCLVFDGVRCTKTNTSITTNDAGKKHTVCKQHMSAYINGHYTVRKCIITMFEQTNNILKNLLLSKLPEDFLHDCIISEENIHYYQFLEILQHVGNTGLFTESAVDSFLQLYVKYVECKCVGNLYFSVTNTETTKNIIGAIKEYEKSKSVALLEILPPESVKSSSVLVEENKIALLSKFITTQNSAQVWTTYSAALTTLICACKEQGLNPVETLSLLTSSEQEIKYILFRNGVVARTESFQRLTY